MGNKFWILEKIGLEPLYYSGDGKVSSDINQAVRFGEHEYAVMQKNVLISVFPTDGFEMFYPKKYRLSYEVIGDN